MNRNSILGLLESENQLSTEDSRHLNMDIDFSIDLNADMKQQRHTSVNSKSMAKIHVDIHLLAHFKKQLNFKEKSAQSYIERDYEHFWKDVLNAVGVLPILLSEENDTNVAIPDTSKEVEIILSVIDFTLKVAEHSFENHYGMVASTFIGYINFLVPTILHVKNVFVPKLLDKVFGVGIQLIHKDFAVSTKCSANLLRHCLKCVLQAPALEEKDELEDLFAIISYMSYRNNLSDELAEMITPFIDIMFEIPLYKFQKKFGKEILSSLITVDEKIVHHVNSKLYALLSNCKPSDALEYGKLAAHSWAVSSHKVKPAIESKLMHHMMVIGLKIHRIEKEHKELKSNCHAYLSGIHLCRTATFSTVITRLYDPMLFSHANDYKNDIWRFNAADILMDVYPLETPGSSRSVYSKYLAKQHETILKLLTDRNVNICSAVIHKTCGNMKYFWDTFQNGTAEKIMDLLVKNISQKYSTAEIRQSVLTGMILLMDNPKSFPLLRKTLPRMKSLFMDANKNVRSSFISLLQKIKETRDFPLEYWNMIDLKDVAPMLVDEGKNNGTRLVNLIFHSFYNSSLSMDSTCRRLIKFLSTDVNVATNLALYSKEVLPCDDAYKILFSLLIMIKKCTKDVYYECHNDDITTEINGSDAPSSNELENLNGHLLIKRPTVLNAVLQYVKELWTLHRAELDEPVNKEKKDHLQKLVPKIVNVVIRCYKGRSPMYSVIGLASMMPLSKLNQTTVESVVISLLKNTKSPDEFLFKVIGHTLLVWKRGAIIIELIMQSINQAFSVEQLNESYIASNGTKKVHFTDSYISPDIALSFLQYIFNDKDDSIIIHREESAMTEFYTFLQPVPTLIERRLNKGEPLHDTLLTDRFIAELLYLYIKLPFIFSSNGYVKFNNQPATLENCMQFCEKAILNHIPDQQDMLTHVPFESMLGSSVLKHLFNAALSQISRRNVDMSIKLLRFIKKVITTGGLGVYYYSCTMVMLCSLVKWMEFQNSQTDDVKILDEILQIFRCQLHQTGTKMFTHENFIHFNIKNDFYRLLIIRFFNFLRPLGDIRIGSMIPFDRAIFYLWEVCIALQAHFINNFSVVPTVDKIGKQPYVLSQLLSTYLRVCAKLEVQSANKTIVIFGNVLDCCKMDKVSLVGALSIVYTIVSSTPSSKHTFWKVIVCHLRTLLRNVFTKITERNTPIVHMQNLPIQQLLNNSSLNDKNDVKNQQSLYEVACVLMNQLSTLLDHTFTLFPN